MKRLTLLSCALAVAAQAAQAQSSDKDFAAWSGIMFTPVGVFPGIETSAGGRTDDARQLALRFSSWSFEGSDVRENSFGVSLINPATSSVRYGFTLGWTQPSGDTGGSNDGLILLGGDIGGALWTSATTANSANSFSLGWKGNLGFGRFTGDGGGNSWSLVGQVPFKWMYKMANKSDLSAYVSAGFGFAGVSDDTDSESGTRPIFGLGGAWTSAGGVGIHLGWQKVPLDTGGFGDVPAVGSLSVSFPVGGKK
jgi:hypothetical protein